MAHKTLIGGTAYELKGGRDLIGGTGYGRKAGKTLIGGAAYDVSFKPATATLKITVAADSKMDGLRMIAEISCGGNEYTDPGEYEVPVGSTVTIKARGRYSSTDVWIYLNGVKVKTGTGSASYDFTISKNTSVECAMYYFAEWYTSVKITEE